MQLTDQQQTRLISVVGCLIESITETVNHQTGCDCQLCRDIQSARDLMNEIDPE